MISTQRRWYLSLRREWQGGSVKWTSVGEQCWGRAVSQAWGWVTEGRIWRRIANMVLKLWQVQLRELPAGRSWQGRRVEAVSSGRMLFLWHFLQVVLLSVLRFCSSSIQLRIYFPIADDVICHIFVYSLLASSRRILTYPNYGEYLYTRVCSSRTCDAAQGWGGRWSIPGMDHVKPRCGGMSHKIEQDWHRY